jgi:hypothetical protein
VRRRRSSLKEREESRLLLKPKLGYELPVEAYLYKYRLLYYRKREDNSENQNNKQWKQ